MTRSARLLWPGAALAALAAGWLAALGAVSAGDLKLSHMFTFDTVRPWLLFQDVFGDGGYPADGWKMGAVTFYLPDYALLWPLYALGADLRAAGLLLPLLFAVLGAGGWMMVCNAMFGHRPMRCAVVVLLHAAAFLALAYGGADLFSFQMAAVYHYGTWTTVPWLLWLALRALDASPGASFVVAAASDSRKKRKAKKRRPRSWRHWRWHGALFVLLALTAASNLIVVAWFVAPTLFVVAALRMSRKIKTEDGARLAAALIAAVVAGHMLLAPALPLGESQDASTFVGIKWERVLFSLSNFPELMGVLISRNKLLAGAWAIFVCAAIWRAWAMWRPASRPGAARNEMFAALYVPAAPVFAVGAALAFGNYFERNLLQLNLGAHRYLLPALYLPLFVGWALMPWPFSARLARAGTAALAAAVFALAVPKAMQLRGDKLDVFNTPFQQCFAAAARRLNWSGGIGSAYMALPMRANPAAGVERMISAGVWRNPAAGESFVFLNWVAMNRHRFNGAFQFVVANLGEERAFLHPPLAGEKGCALSEGEWCVSPSERYFFLDERSARAAFGAPAETVDCAGVTLLHYDPPLRFDFSAADNPQGARLGRNF